MAKQASMLSREERDLLIRLDTKMTAVETKLADMAGNYTQRLLNLEGNAVSKIEMDALEVRVRNNEIEMVSVSTSFKTWGIVGGGIFTIAQIAIGVIINIFV